MTKTWIFLMSLMVLLATNTLMASDQILGPVVLKKRAIELDYQSCIDNLKIAAGYGQCEVQALQPGENCFEFEFLPSQNSPRFLFQTGEQLQSVEFIPNPCGYRIEIYNRSAVSFEALIQKAINNSRGVLEFFVYSRP